MTLELIDLSTNENPLGPSPKVIDAIVREAHRIHRYPARDDAGLRTALAGHHGRGLAPDHFFAASSASEVLDMITRATLTPGDEAIISSPTFPVYGYSVKNNRGVLVDAPLDPVTCAHDVTRMLAAVTSRTRLLYLCNPGNPTGVLMPATEFRRLLDGLPLAVLVVADEVYHQYVDDPAFPDTIAHLHEGREVVIVHSFSKGYGMAGLRLGYGIARPELVSRLGQFRLTYGLSGPAQAAGIAAVADQEHVARTVALTATGRRVLSEGLTQLGVRHWPSNANFLLVAPADPDQALNRLAEMGIQVRPVAGPGQIRCLRISIGLPAATERVFDAFASLGASS